MSKKNNKQVSAKAVEVVANPVVETKKAVATEEPEKVKAEEAESKPEKVKAEAKSKKEAKEVKSKPEVKKVSDPDTIKQVVECIQKRTRQLFELAEGFRVPKKAGYGYTDAWCRWVSGLINQCEAGAIKAEDLFSEEEYAKWSLTFEELVAGKLNSVTFYGKAH